MLFELYIKNCALIDEIRVEFGEKLNILTGETGSGKSIIIEALNLCLGGRYDRTFLRKGCDRGAVEGIFFSDNKKLNKIIKENGFELEDKNKICVSRALLKDGKTVNRINGKTVKVSILKKIMSLIVDIHGQHQNQILYDRENHIEFLDMYGCNIIKEEVENYKIVYSEYLDLKRKLHKLNDNKNEMEIQRELDLLKFQINEIEVAELDEMQYKELKEKRELYRNSEKICNTLNSVYEMVHDKPENLRDLTGSIYSEIEGISNLDTELKEISTFAEQIMYDCLELNDKVRDYKDNLNFYSDELETIEEKLDDINKLKRKYGNTISDIINYLDKIKKRLDEIENREELNKNLNIKIESKIKEVKITAKKLTEKRKIVAVDLEKKLLSELKSLNMGSTAFEVSFSERTFFDKGADEIDFKVSFNLGEDLNSISKVASGGEMSRFMLAFKTILADTDKIETMIFDEIDTGISGNAAQVVGEKLKKISEKKQIICITHLPQIAAKASEHYCIEKNVYKERTLTNVKKLNQDQRVKEISRLIYGGELTKKTIEHANEILKFNENNV